MMSYLRSPAVLSQDTRLCTLPGAGEWSLSQKIPWTEVFDSLAQWLERMKADHGDYTYGESS